MGAQQVLILIVSGSSANFISSSLVESLGCTVAGMLAAHVTIANGAKMTSDTGIPAFNWGFQNIKFSIDVRVLDLPCYDMILGMEWLIQFSPMWVDWRIKNMRIRVNGTKVTLRGIKDNVVVCPVVSKKQLTTLFK